MGRRASDQPRTTRGVALTDVQYKRCTVAADVSSKTFSAWAADLLDAHAVATLKGGLGTCFRCKSIDTRYFSKLTQEYVCKKCSEKYELLLQDYTNTKSFSVEVAFHRLLEAIEDLRVAMAEQEKNVNQKLQKSNAFAHILSKGVTPAHTELTSTSKVYSRTSTDSAQSVGQYISASKVYSETSTDSSRGVSQNASESKVYSETSTDLAQNVGQYSSTSTRKASSPNPNLEPPNPNLELMVRLLSTPVDGEGDEE